LTKGDIHETKVQVKSEESFRKLTELLDAKKKNYYTYQLKSSKGLQLFIKGIEPDVGSAEVEQALKDKGFNEKTVSNIRNRNKQPQLLFNVELVLDSKALKKNEIHPIYNFQFLLHRRITIEEPHKRNGQVQCANCQEYGHTKSYCTLRSVCVACGGWHTSAKCQVWWTEGEILTLPHRHSNAPLQSATYIWCCSQLSQTSTSKQDRRF